MSTFCFTQMPPDITLYTFSYLPCNTLGLVGGTCKNFNLLSKIDNLWSPFQISLTGDLLKKTLLLQESNNKETPSLSKIKENVVEIIKENQKLTKTNSAHSKSYGHLQLSKIGLSTLNLAVTFAKKIETPVSKQSLFPLLCSELLKQVNSEPLPQDSKVNAKQSAKNSELFSPFKMNLLNNVIDLVKDTPECIERGTIAFKTLVTCINKKNLETAASLIEYISPSLDGYKANRALCRFIWSASQHNEISCAIEALKKYGQLVLWKTCVRHLCQELDDKCAFDTSTTVQKLFPQAFEEKYPNELDYVYFLENDQLEKAKGVVLNININPTYTIMFLLEIASRYKELGNWQQAKCINELIQQISAFLKSQTNQSTH